MAKEMTINQAKEIMGEALCRVLGIPRGLTSTGKLTVKTKRMLNAAGYYWFPGLRVWKKLAVAESAKQELAKTGYAPVEEKPKL